MIIFDWFGVQAGAVAYAMYASTRTYCGGCIISAIAYFSYILLVKEIEPKPSKVKAASLTEALKDLKQDMISATKKFIQATKKRVVATTLLALCGAIVQTVSIAALQQYGCSGNKGQFAPFPDISATEEAGRGLLGQPSNDELELLRCSFNLSVQW